MADTPASHTRASDAGLVVAHLSVTLGHRRVVNEVGFTAALGQITVLLGPNGAGKSTVLKAVAGVLPYQGQIRFGTVDAASLDPRARARRVAYVPQVSALDAPMPVREVVAQGRFACGEGISLLPAWWRGPRADDVQSIQSALERTDTVALADRTYSQLSHGERRRVLIARALASGAGVLLLDEPTAALDVGHALGLLSVLRQVAAEGKAVVMVLHQLQEAAAVAHHVVLLQRGEVVHAGSPADVITQAPVRAVYGVDLIPEGQFACRLPEGRHS
ncbi:MAG TPA: ABC transporter ATP-binding protein [Polyangia bacterium]